MAHTLLLADGNVATHRLVESTLSAQNVRVVAVPNGQQALERLAHERPDIVLADVTMPDVDGYAVATFVAGQPLLRGVPVVLLLSALDPVDDRRVRESGAAGVLVKPLEPEIVTNRVKELLDRKNNPGDKDTVLLPPRELTDPGLKPLTPRTGLPSLAPAPPLPSPLPPPLPPPAPPPLAAASQTPFDAPFDLPAPEPEPEAPIADAFDVLLAAEQGEILPPNFTITPELIDKLATRVAEKMASDAVAKIVAETSERLVKEEIARIRAAAQSKKP